MRACVRAALDPGTKEAPAASAQWTAEWLAEAPAGIPTGQPTLKWFQSGYGIASGITTFATAPNSASQPVATGDLLILIYTIGDAAGGTDHALQCPSGGTSTWTRVAQPSPDSVGGTNAVMCYAIAAAGETGTNNVTWTTANTRSATWLLLDYGNVTSIGVTGVAKSTGTTISSFSSTCSIIEATTSVGLLITTTPVGSFISETKT